MSDKIAQYKKASKSQIYKGVQFDSKHEVRWVRFLEACGFVWEREPLEFIHPKNSDLSWRPDLRITHQDGRVFLVEIKPTAEFFNIEKTMLARLRFHDCLLLTSAPPLVTGFCRVFGQIDLRNLFPENWLDLWQETEFV